MALAVIIACVSCKEDEPSALTGISIDETNLYLLIGQEHKFRVTFEPESAETVEVSWASSDPAVASISEAGELTALTEGKTVITVTTAEGGFTATCNVEVAKEMVPVTRVTLNESSLTKNRDEKVQLVATVEPEDATFKDVEWASSNPEVATVTQNGLVEAKSLGTTTITVTTKEGKKTAFCDIIVDDSEFTIIFQTNGGTEIASQIIQKGEKLTEPEAPIKTGGLEAGLYLGDVLDPDEGVGYEFAGWYEDEKLTQPFNFNTEIRKDYTLYAKWNSSSEYESIPEISDIQAAVDYVNAKEEGGEYTYVLGEDVSAAIKLENINAKLHIVGTGSERTITGIGGNVIHVFYGFVTIGKNIVLSGNFAGSSAAVYLDGDDNHQGSLTMRNGSKIANCISTYRASAVYLSNGGNVFTMDGGEICDNQIEISANAYAGTICLNWGKIIINGGTIENNSVKCTVGNFSIAGAIFIPHRNGPELEINGGEIKGNTAIYDNSLTGVYAGQQVLLGAATQASNGIYKVDNDITNGTTLKSEGVKGKTQDQLNGTPWIRVN